MITVLTLVLTVIALYFLYKLIRKGSSHTSSIVKQVARVVVNKTTDALKSLEDLEQSLTNALKESKMNYEKYIENCKEIFKLEEKFTKQLEEKERAKDKLDKDLKALKDIHNSITDEPRKAVLKKSIALKLEDLSIVEDGIDELRPMLDYQIEQNKRVRDNLILQQKKIAKLEDRIEYVKNQYLIAKNKNLMNNRSDDSLFDVNEIIKSVEDYIYKADASEKVENILKEDEVKHVAIEKNIKDINKEDRLAKFLES